MFKVVKKVLNKQTCQTIHDYLLLKRRVYYSMAETNQIILGDERFGTHEDKQVKNAFAAYGDVLLDSLLERLRPTLEKKLKKKLYPTYSYFRIYRKGCVLKRHKDREECNSSMTLSISGEKWPFYFDKNKENGGYTKDTMYIPGTAKGTKIMLSQGDVLMYDGTHEHWREPLEYDECTQVFLHYIDANHSDAETRKFDKRFHLGLPSHMDRYNMFTNYNG